MSLTSKASACFIVSNIVLKGISLITTPIFTRFMDVTDYGTISMYVTLQGLFSVFATLNLSGGVYNVAMTKFEDINEYTSSMFGLESILSFFVYTLIIIFNSLFADVFDLPNIYIVFMWIQTLFNAFISFWLVRMRFNYAYKPVLIYTILSAIISPSLAILGIILFPSNMAIAKVIGAGIFGLIFGVIIFAITYKNSSRLYFRKYWKYALAFNIPLLPHYLSSNLLGSTDKLMIDNIVGREITGFYSVSQSMVGVVSVIINAINSSMIPYTLQSIKNAKYDTLKEKINFYLKIIVVICVGVMLFSREAIILLASTKYLDSIQYIPPLIVAAFLSFLMGLLGNIQFYYNKRCLMSTITMVSALVNLGLNYIGINLFGAIAASYATAITNIMGFSILYYNTKKCEKNLNMIFDIKLIIILFVIILASGSIAIAFQYSFIIRVLAMLILGLCIYTISRGTINNDD
ncbi:MAG: oligosaccharide flippase family protein [Bacillota bacterium]